MPVSCTSRQNFAKSRLPTSKRAQHYTGRSAVESWPSLAQTVDQLPLRPLQVWSSLGALKQTAPCSLFLGLLERPAVPKSSSEFAEEPSSAFFWHGQGTVLPGLGGEVGGNGTIREEQNLLLKRSNQVSNM